MRRISEKDLILLTEVLARTDLPAARTPLAERTKNLAITVWTVNIVGFRSDANRRNWKTDAPDKPNTDAASDCRGERIGIAKQSFQSRIESFWRRRNK